jgi:hypothetical protein
MWRQVVVDDLGHGDGLDLVTSPATPLTTAAASIVL